MKKRAFTLAEVLVAVVFLGLITAGLFPFLAYELKNVNRSFAFTKDTFELQTEVEHAVVDLNERVEGKDVDTISDKDWGEWKKLRVKMFNGLETKIVARTVSSKEKDIQTGNSYKRDAIIMLPQKRFEGPKIPKITVTLEKDMANNKKYKGKVLYKGTESNDVSLVVYRWYLGNNSDKVGNKINPSNLVMIREYNEAKNGGKERFFEKATQFISSVKQDITKSMPFTLAGESLKLDYFYSVAYLDGLVPLIFKGVSKDKDEKKKGDNFHIDSLNMNMDVYNQFTEKEMQRFYNNKALVFSAMIVTNEGALGEEVFSDALDLNFRSEEYMFGQSTVKVDDGKGNYRLTYYFKQLNNLEKFKEYYFYFYHKDHNKNYYLVPHPTESNTYTVVKDYDLGTRLKVDDDGIIAFRVYLPKGKDFEYVLQHEVEKGKYENIATGVVN